jgi:general secretion pathway protein G
VTEKAIMNSEFSIMSFRDFLSLRLKKFFRNSALKIQRSKLSFSDDGFTFIELLLVLAILSLLSGIVAVVSLSKIRSSKESALKADLSNLRKALDDYYGDSGKYPKELQDLVDKHYIRAVPQDPFTESSETWKPVYSEDPSQKDAIVDIHSGSEEKTSDGDNYSEW